MSDAAKARENYFNPDGTLNELARKLLLDVRDRATIGAGVRHWDDDPQAWADRAFLLELISGFTASGKTLLTRVG